MKIFLTFLLCGLCVPVFSQGTLFLSEYVEGSSNNKALEIYNATDSTVDLEKDKYVLLFFFNGVSTPNTTLSLKGILPKGDVFVIVHKSLTLPLAKEVIDQKDSSAPSWFNGDDAIVLRKGGTSGQLIDVIGQIGFDPGTEWSSKGVSTLDGTMRRKPEILSGETNGADVFDPSVQWQGFDRDDVSGLGFHGPFSFSSTQISFISNAVNEASPSQSYTVKTIEVSEHLHLEAGPNFKIAKTEQGEYKDTLYFAPSLAQEGVTVFVKYLPISTGNHSDLLLHKVGNSSAAVRLLGSVWSGMKKIGEIQGSSTSSPYVGQKVSITGIVTADIQKAEQQKGFYMQDVEPDNDPLTSDGLFVFDNLFGTDVQKGQIVIVDGEVAETFGQTQLKSITNIQILDTFQTVNIDAATLTLPVDSLGSFEKYEGMLVRFPQTLVVTETYNLGRFGEVSLSLNERLSQPTEIIDLNDVNPQGTSFNGTSQLAQVLAKQNLNNRSTLLLADNLSTENPNPIPFINPTTRTLRAGSSLTQLKGVLGYDFGTYRLYADSTPHFNYSERPDAPSRGNANLVVAGMNVLNFFNGDGAGAGFPTSRGAKTLQEFKRQKSKIVAAIKTMDADVVGLMEIENDGNSSASALKELVDSLNSAYGTITYAFATVSTDSNGNPGTDEIKVALIYKPAKVVPVGSANYFNHPAFEGLGRPPFAQTFQHVSTQEKFTFIVNHFKSKGCTGSTGEDVDSLDGQGCFTATRKLQSEALCTFIQKMIAIAGDSDVVSIGDYNSYGQEDPLDVLRSHGLINLVENTYSYVFNGQFGSLDHAFITPSFQKQIEKAYKWHINADEPPVTDYTLAYKTQDLYQPSPYRSSDHDPVLVNIQLSALPNSLKLSEHSFSRKIFPNPVLDGTLHATENISGQLVDLFGNKMVEFKNQKDIWLQNVPKGMYYLWLDNNGSLKVVVK